jgi:carboxylesterase type B
MSAELLPNLTSELCYWLPTIDGTVLSDLPQNLFAAGKFHKVPLIVGSTLQDDALGLYAVFGSTNISDLEEYASYLGEFGFVSPVVADVYSNAAAHPFWRVVAASTDWNLRCPSRRLCRAFQQFNVSCFLYSFDFFTATSNPYNLSAPLRACHGSELPFVFGRALPQPADPPVLALSNFDAAILENHGRDRKSRNVLACKSSWHGGLVHVL